LLERTGEMPAPTSVTMEVTLGCNLHCTMCFQNDYRDRGIAKEKSWAWMACFKLDIGSHPDIPAVRGDGGYTSVADGLKHYAEVITFGIFTGRKVLDRWMFIKLGFNPPKMTYRLFILGGGLFL